MSVRSFPSDAARAATGLLGPRLPSALASAFGGGMGIGAGSRGRGLGSGGRSLAGTLRQGTIRQVTADARDGNAPMKLAIDSEVLDVLKLADQHGLRISFAGGTARRMAFGDKPIAAASDLDLVVHLPAGAQPWTLGGQVDRFRAALERRFPQLHIDIMNLTADGGIESP